MNKNSRCEHVLVPWDCGCSFGCESCGRNAECLKCGDIIGGLPIDWVDRLKLEFHKMNGTDK